MIYNTILTYIIGVFTKPPHKLLIICPKCKFGYIVYVNTWFSEDNIPKSLYYLSCTNCDLHEVYK